MTKKILLLPFLLLTIAATALAADYLPKDPKNAENISVSGPEIYKNLYIGGSNVAINKEILGDLFVGGGSVNISGPIEKDLFAAGGNINISSPIGDDARVAGGNLILNSQVGGDLLIAGGTISLGSGSDIGGDLWAAGGVINLNSDVAGNGKIAGGQILINAGVAGDLEVRADEKLVFGPNSKVTGKITYYGKKEAVVQNGAQITPIDFKIITRKEFAPIKGIFSAFLFIKIVALFIATLFILKILGKTSSSIISYSYESPWKNLGVGLFVLIIIPIAIMILMFAAIGFYAGMILAAWFVLAALIAAIFAVLFIGSLIEKLVFRKKEIDLTWKTAALGAVGGAILTLVPLLGWLATTILYIISFGALLKITRERLELKK